MPTRRFSPFLKWIAVAAVVVALFVLGSVLLGLARTAVTVTAVVEGPAVQAFYATGTLEPADREHPLRAGVSGFIQLADPGMPQVGKGDRVSRGQVLAVVVDEGLRHTADKAEADLAEKRARADAKTSPVLQEMDAKIAAYGELVGAAEREFARYGAGIEAKFASRADYDKSLDRLKTLVSEHESFKAQKLQAALKLVRELAESESALKTARWNLEQMKVVSPIDGFVLDTPQQVGVKVNVNDLVVTVADTSPGNLVMRAQVDEEDVTKVQPPSLADGVRPTLAALFGLDRLLDGWTRPPQVVRMTLYAFADRPFTGRVARIYPKADPDRRTFEVDVRIDGPSPRMQAGMTGELTFEMFRKDKAQVVPAQALQDGKIWAVRDGKLTPTEAQIGLSGVERVEIVSGLRPGDQVVISPVAGIEPGRPVRVGQTMDPIEAANLNKPKKKELFRGGF